jgi:glycosyltransferase involved in cell wall biosynthesis
LLASLAAQTRRPDEVVVVDDGSIDGTAEVAAAAGVTVVGVDGPPDGWTGKTWACHAGVAATSADTLVLLDADTWLAPDAVERLLSHHDRDVAGGLLSVQPYHETRRPYEELSAMCNLVAVLAAGLGAVRPPRSSPVAFGPCLVTSRAGLAAAGGFVAVRADVIEDAALAARYRAAGRPVRCLLGGSTVRFRMYPDGVRALVDGWTKNLAGGARRAPLLPTLGASAVVCLLFALAVEVGRDRSWSAAAAWLTAAGALWWALRRVGSFRWWTAVAFPVPLVAFTALVLRSVWARTVRRSVVWRGRRVPVG